MGFQKGRQQFIGIKREATRLTAETTGFTFLPWNERAIVNENTHREVQSSLANRGALVTKLLESQHAVVNFGDHADADTITEALFAIFGAETKSTALGATTRDFTFNQNIELPTFTTVVSEGDIGQRVVNGCVASKFTLNTTMEEAMYSVEAFGVRVANTSGITATYAAPNKYFQGRHISLSYADTKAGLSSGTAITSVISSTTEIDNGVDANAHKYLGSLNPANMTSDGITAQFEFETNVGSSQAATFQTWHDTGAVKAFKLSIVASNLPVIGTSALRPTLEIEFPPSTVVVENTVNLDEIIKQKVTVQISTPNLITAKLINAVA